LLYLECTQKASLKWLKTKREGRREGNVNFVKFGKTGNIVNSRSVHRACALLRSMYDGAVNAPEQMYAIEGSIIEMSSIHDA